MSIKKIFPSNGNGKGAESSIVTYNDATNIVSGSKATVTTMTVGSLNGLLQEVGGVVASIDTSTAVSGNILQANGGQFAPAAATLETLGGDLSGILSNPTVKSIANVVSGTLKINVGGTNKNALSASAPLVLKSELGSPTNNSVITMNSSGSDFAYADKSVVDVVPMTGTLVYLYTGSVNTVNTSATSTVFTWTKPQGAKFIRVICQAAGGGGGTGAGSNSGGKGGGGGGYGDVVYNLISMPDSVTVTVGDGGYAYRSGAPAGGVAGGGGGSSSFGKYLISYGGSAGYPGSTAPTIAGGAGYKSTGGTGGYAKGGTLTAGGSVVLGGAGGGSGGGGDSPGSGGSTSVGYNGGSITYLNITGGIGGGLGLTAGAPQEASMFPFQKVILNNIPDSSFPNLICGGGGGGGGNSGWGTSATFGSGGGGGGSVRTTGAAGAGGYGGKGYVLIICY
jgi:hypothetical protein